MRIGLKLSTALLVPMVTLTAVLGFAYLDRSRELLREELAKEGRAIARVVQIASEDYLRDRQVADLRQLADQISGYERVLGVRLFDSDANMTYQPAGLDPFPFRSWSELRRALAENRTVEMRRLIGQQPAVGFIVPLHNRSGSLVGAVQILQLESYVAQDERSTRDFILLLTLVMTLATLGVVLVVTRLSISRPIENLVKSFRDVGARDVPTRVEVRGNDELAGLSREFNGMCERLERTHTQLMAEQEHRRMVERQLRIAERLAGLGRLAAGLAHEIGTPLNVIIGRAESVLRTVAGQEAAERNLRIVVSQGERIARIVRDMLDFARMKPSRQIPTNVPATLRSVLDLTERQCEAHHVRVTTEWPADLPPLDADPDQLQQVFLNLVVNALDAMPAGGTLRIAIERVLARRPAGSGGEEACLAVTFEDTGTGIAPDDVGRVFDPFFTTKPPGQGTGLGLSVSYGIIEEHGGWFDVDSRPGEGTRFTILLPLAGRGEARIADGGNPSAS